MARIHAADSTAESPSELPTPHGLRFAQLLPPLKSGHWRLYLIRHGQTDWNVRGLLQGGGYDIPLNDMGKLQAASAASELSAVPIDVVCSSHLSRAHATADALHAAVSAARGPGPVARAVDPRFGEMRFGSFEGSPVKGEGAPREVRPWELSARGAPPALCAPPSSFAGQYT